MGQMYAVWDKMDPARREQVLSEAENFLSRME